MYSGNLIRSESHRSLADVSISQLDFSVFRIGGKGYVFFLLSWLGSMQRARLICVPDLSARTLETLK